MVLCHLHLWENDSEKHLGSSHKAKPAHIPVEPSLFDDFTCNRPGSAGGTVPDWWIHFNISVCLNQKGKKKPLSARELNSCAYLPRVPQAVCQREFFPCVLHFWSWRRWGKRQNSVYSFKHCSLLAAGVVISQAYRILSTIAFLGFATFQGRKHVLLWRNQAYGYSQFSYLLPVLTRKTILLLLHISLSVLISVVEIFSVVISVPQEVIFHRSGLFSPSCQHCCNFPPTFSHYKVLVLGPLVISVGSAFVPHISGHAISSPNYPSTICAMPCFGFCWKPISEPRCSGGWKTTSNFLTMSISDHLISICSHASTAFFFNSSFPSFEFTSPVYL